MQHEEGQKSPKEKKDLRRSLHKRPLSTYVDKINSTSANRKYFGHDNSAPPPELLS